MAILEFDRSRKSMSCLVKVGDGVNRLLVKVCERKSKVTTVLIPNPLLSIASDIRGSRHAWLCREVSYLCKLCDFSTFFVFASRFSGVLNRVRV